MSRGPTVRRGVSTPLRTSRGLTLALGVAGLALAAAVPVWACTITPPAFSDTGFDHGIPGSQGDLTVSGAWTGPVTVTFGAENGPTLAQQTFVANKNQVWTPTVTIPANARPGVQPIFASGKDKNSEPAVKAVPFQVLEPPLAAGAAGAGGTAPVADKGTSDAPSGGGTGLRTGAQATRDQNGSVQNRGGSAQNAAGTGRPSQFSRGAGTGDQAGPGGPGAGISVGAPAGSASGGAASSTSSGGGPPGSNVTGDLWSGFGAGGSSKRTIGLVDTVHATQSRGPVAPLAVGIVVAAAGLAGLLVALALVTRRRAVLTSRIGH